MNTIKDYECYNLACPVLKANPAFDVRADGYCDKAVKLFCDHPFVSPGMCIAACASAGDYDRLIKPNIKQN